MDKKRCYIMGAGDYTDSILPDENDYVIAADGGYAALLALGVEPNLVIGDFDSLGEEPNHPNIIRSSSIKDDTDMMLAVRQGLKLGYTAFVLNGGVGSRLDHTYANIQTLVYLAENNARGILAGKNLSITAIKDGKLMFNPSGEHDRTVSVFSFNGKAEGVTLEGVKYPLKDAALTNSFPLGVSNEFTGDKASIEVKNGILIIMTDFSAYEP